MGCKGIPRFVARELTILPMDSSKMHSWLRLLPQMVRVSFSAKAHCWTMERELPDLRVK